MSDNPFFDSNVLLYLASDDGAKANRAEALLADGGTISVQVLNEMSNAAIRKHGMTWSQVSALLEPVRVLCRIEPLTEATYDLGAQLAARYRFSVYDAMIVAAALLAGADILYSEDMHDGLLVEDRLRIRNPFRVRSVQER
ncbi:PIN domain-containing protein [Thermomonas sp.]|uniref:PIN domain-containing protein n=1 Tax=Thermomonas sp. TaxID=1971895 RepID=UPI002629CE0C|nr:PIN domain-containing protein [Thermomonas sp.]MBL0227549.1 PIN domain-containing protein [Thermomonas sp.]